MIVSMKQENKKLGRPKKEKFKEDAKVYYSIFEIFGDKKPSAYSYRDIASYEAFLDSLPLAEMQRHAITLEIIPQKTRASMKRVLLDKYKKYMAENIGLLEDCSTHPKSIFEIMNSAPPSEKTNKKPESIFDII